MMNGLTGKDSMIERSQRVAARTFAITYLLGFAILMVAFSRFYAPYLVWDNGEETARHFATHEQAIRLYLTGGLLYGVGVVVLSTTLYVILRPVNQAMALFAAFSKLAYSVFWFIWLLDIFGALHLLGSAGPLRAFGTDGVAALAGLQLDSSRDAYYVGLVFNGLGSALFAWVLFRARYVPRILTMWGLVASLYEGFCGFAYLIHPGFGLILSANWYELPAITFELLLCLWFLYLNFRPPETVLGSPHQTSKIVR